jgi:hypothetical protein
MIIDGSHRLPGTPVVIPRIVEDIRQSVLRFSTLLQDLLREHRPGRRAQRGPIAASPESAQSGTIRTCLSGGVSRSGGGPRNAR